MYAGTEYGSRSLLRWKPITSFLPASRLEADSIYIGWKPSTEFGWKPVFTFWLEARIYVLAGSPFLLESDLEGPARGLGWKPARRFFRTDSSSLAMFAEGSRNITWRRSTPLGSITPMPVGMPLAAMHSFSTVTSRSVAGTTKRQCSSPLMFISRIKT